MTTETIDINKCGTTYKCGRCLKGVGFIGIIVNTFLAILKLAVGIAFFSTALLADALYSLLDLGYSILIIVGLKISAKPPDDNHNYGHGKVEFVISVAFSVVSIIGAIVLFLFALFELHDGVIGTFSGYVVLVALISTVGNYLFYKFTNCVANQFNSPSIHALAIHSKADAITSALVGVSMGFVYYGYHHAGPIVAIIETVHILIIGTEIFRSSIFGLLDASIPQEDIRKIKSVLNNIHGISNVNYVKSRKVGQGIWLNIEIEVPSTYNIRQIDGIKETVNEMTREKVGRIDEIMINIRPFRTVETEEELSMVGS